MIFTENRIFFGTISSFSCFVPLFSFFLSHFPRTLDKCIEICYNDVTRNTTVRHRRILTEQGRLFAVMSDQAKSWVVVDAAVLPEVILKTLQVKRMLANREEKSSSAACRAAGISRSAFYKYRDSVFVYEEQMREQIFTVYMRLHDEAGVLSGVLHALSAAHANVLTLNQSVPVDGAAAVTVSFRLEAASEVAGLCQALSERRGVLEVRLLSGS